MKRRRLLLGCLALAIALSACRPQATLTVGLLNPQTGSLADAGVSCMEGAKLAVRELNDAGGLVAGDRRCRIALVVGDCRDTPEAAVSAALDLINNRDVSVIIGPPFSVQAVPVARLAERSRVPMITQLSTNIDVTRGMSWVFRVCFTDQFEGHIMARFARENLHARRAAVLYDMVNPFTRDVTAVFKATFEDAGGRVTAEEPYPTGVQDFDQMLLRIKASVPDVLFMPGLAPDLRIQLMRMRELGIRAAVIGSDTMHFRDRRDILLAEGAYLLTHFSADVPTPAVIAYDATFAKAYGRRPTPGSALTYDAFHLLARIVREQGSIEPSRIRAGLAGVDRYEGVTGSMVFSGRADPLKSGVIIRAQDGEYRFAALVSP